MGDAVSGFAGFAESNEDAVGMDMDGRADDDHGHTNKEAGVGEVGGGVGVAGEAEVASVEVTVDRVEEDGGGHDEKGHLFAGGADSKGEDEGPVDVVDDPYAGEDDEGEREGGPAPGEAEDECGGGDGFHTDPAEACGDVGAPAFAVVASVGGGDPHEEDECGGGDGEACVEDGPEEGVFEFGHWWFLSGGNDSGLAGGIQKFFSRRVGVLPSRQHFGVAV